MPRRSNYTLLIICEGKNTEPQFFGSIRDRINEGTYVVEDMVITIRPEPKAEQPAKKDEESDLKPVRKRRELLPAKREFEEEIKGVPPLKWVLAGQEELRDGTFNEVWVVFDNDNHPARREAFQQADEVINGKKVRIAYSSIAFEYYLLLHFERIYKKFETSECREDKKPIHCSTGEHKSDCKGARCIGGYARSRKYWDDSKGRNSIFLLTEDKLKTGFWNANWLRNESDRWSGGIPFYERNPYVTTDDIIKRLTGYEGHHFEVVGYDQDLDIDSKLRIRFLPDRSIQLLNLSSVSLILLEASITRLLIRDDAVEMIGERKVIKPGEKIALSFAPDVGDDRVSEYVFNFNSWHILLNQ